MLARDLICIPEGYMVERLILKFYQSTSDKRKIRKLIHAADFTGETIYVTDAILVRRFPHLVWTISKTQQNHANFPIHNTAPWPWQISGAKKIPPERDGFATDY